MPASAVDPPPGDLDIRIAPGPDGRIVTVAGDIDVRSAPVLVEQLLEVLRRPEVTPVELDLRQVTYLNSAGLTALVVLHRAAQTAGRTLRMRCGTGRAVLRPLQITGLTTVLTLVD